MAFKLFFGSPAAGGAPTAYTLTADTGTLVLTGNAAVTQAARNLIAASGAIVLTGVAANTLVARNLIAASGAIVLTGNAAVTQVARKLTAAAGAIALTGSTAALTRGLSWQFLGISNVVEVTGTAHALVTTGIAGTLAAGDLLVACIASRIASTTSITLPTGGEWTLVSEQKNNNTATNTTATPSGLMAYCVRGASNPNLTFTHPTAPSVALGRIVAYRNVDTASPKDTQSSFTTATNQTAVTGTGLTTAQTNDLIVAMTAGGQEAAWSAFNATSPAGASGTTSTAAPTSAWLERGDSNTATGADTSLAIFDAVKAATGATGNLTATASIAAAQVVVAGAFKLALPAVIAHVLTADTAAFVLAGQPAALTTIRHYKLLATTGALTLTGFAAGTRYGRILTAVSGAFALTGFAAATRTARKLTAASGAVVLTGFAATLIGTAKVLAANSGTIVLTGNAAITRHAHKLVAVTGTLALSGNAAITRYARKLIAASSTFLLSGSAAILRRAHILAATTGTLVWSGFAAALSTAIARSMLAATGTLTLTGADATLRVAHVYKLIAASGTFVLTGAAAPMWRTRTLAAASGTFTLTGLAANFFTNRAIMAWSDSIVLTGTAATLRIWRIPPPPEMLRFGRTVYAIPGRW